MCNFPCLSPSELKWSLARESKLPCSQNHSTHLCGCDVLNLGTYYFKDSLFNLKMCDSVWVYALPCVLICVWVSVWVYVLPCVLICVCVCFCVSVCAALCAYMCVYVCVSVWLYCSSVCLCVFTEAQKTHRMQWRYRRLWLTRLGGWDPNSLW